MQKKNITLHAKSHHPLRTKVEVAKNFYKTAEKSSSSVDFAEESKSLVDKLLLCNGYTDPRTFIKTHIPTPNMSYISMEEKVCLKIPYVSEFVSYEILRYIRKRKLPINVIFTPEITFAIYYVNRDLSINLTVFSLTARFVSYLKIM